MIIHVLTIFPDMFKFPLHQSILGKAQERGHVDINIHNLRDFADGRRRTTDDTPYGGGCGMVMKPEPVYKAVDHIKKESKIGIENTSVILTCPQGERFDQDMANELKEKHTLIFICGRYEGVDERIRNLVNREVSIGDYVLTGGELPAMVIIDTIARLIPGVLGNQDSIKTDSFFGPFLGYPQYTRPPVFRGLRVPKVLLSGNHNQIELWRKKKSLERTLLRRPDILKN
ncbi:tRNA (guanosine(37)-N1)-methyltransferase TrmD [bacterium]|nr:tRNA (guanosine(37)-N1)-methyltransferase TrmD [bacterium]